VTTPHDSDPALDTQPSPLDPAGVARTLVDIAADRQATDTVLLDIRGIAAFADYFIISTALNPRHLQALIQEMEEGIKRQGVRLYHREGSEESGWVLLDFGDVIVHLFLAAERERYGLEQLWRSAVPVLRIQ
jgi:ribosome-associated protein